MYISVPAIRSEARIAQFAVAYLLAVGAAEVVTAHVEPVTGVVLHIAILMAVLTCCVRMTSRVAQVFLLPLLILPLIRIVSLGLPLGEFSRPWWYVLPSVPLLVAAIAVMRSLALTRQQVGLQFPALRNWPLTLAVMCSGFGLGWIEYQILDPVGVVDTTQMTMRLLPVGAIMIGVGFVEELIFRGILQTTTQVLFHPAVSIIYVSVLFMILHTGHLSLLHSIFALAVGLYFGAVVLKTESLLAVVLAHGILNITALVVLPILAA